MVSCCCCPNTAVAIGPVCLPRPIGTTTSANWNIYSARCANSLRNRTDPSAREPNVRFLLAAPQLVFLECSPPLVAVPQDTGVFILIELNTSYDPELG
jgi:hypothetical protein